MEIKRCKWANKSHLLQNYHDNEWGKPIYNDDKLFEMLILEGQSCGLSWELILKKRKNIYKAFDNLNPKKLIQYDEQKIHQLMHNPGIIRSKTKIEGIIHNANAYLKLKEKNTFNDFIWSYVEHKPIVNNGKQFVTQNDISIKLSKDLRKLGFKFVGPVITYSFMQAVGMINDHEYDCSFR